MTVEPEPLDVDGARPAVVHVACLPRAYRLTEAEWRVLMVLACDSYDGQTSAPGLDNLAAWTGLLRSSVAAAVTRLTEPTPHRPALLAREDTRRGRRRTVFRLLLDPNRPGAPDCGQPANRPASPEGTDVANRPANRPANHPANHPASPDANRPAQPETPYSLDPPPGGSASTDRRLAAAAADALAAKGIAGPDARALAAYVVAVAAEDAATASPAGRLTKDARWRAKVITEARRRLNHDRRPPWCGDCDEGTRHREALDGRPYRCPACHPLRGAA